MIKEKRLRVDYENFGNFTCYTGRIGSGMTLASVIHAVELQKITSMPIVTNMTNTSLPNHETFEWGKLWRYKDSIVLLDALWSLQDTRRPESRRTRDLELFLRMLRKSNCFVIANTNDVLHLDKRVRTSITDLLNCHFVHPSTLYLQKSFIDENEERHVVLYDPINTEPYFDYYNSYEILDLLNLQY